jgi:hypothetical protein
MFDLKFKWWIIQIWRYAIINPELARNDNNMENTKFNKLTSDILLA